MANRTNTNPIFIDTWSSDIVLSTKDGAPLTVRKVRLLSAAAGDTFALDNALGEQTFRMVQETNDRMVDVDFGDDGFKFTSGVTIDVSDCTGLGAGDYCWIYLK